MWSIGNLIEKRGEVCEEVRKRMIDVCCLQEVRWKRQGARMMGMEGRRCKLWWCGNGDRIGAGEAMVKEELCEKGEG